jgi:hypothetical protein
MNSVGAKNFPFGSDLIRRFFPDVITICIALSTFPAYVSAEGSPTLVESSQVPAYIKKIGDAFVYEKIPLDDSTGPEYVFVSYLGKEPSGPLIEYRDGSMTVALRCYENCQYVKWSAISDGKIRESGRIRTINDPLIYSIIRDATSGLLD